MPNISYQTPILDDGSSNPNVASNSLLILGDSLAPDANIQITVQDTQTQIFTTSCDDSGTLNYLLTLTDFTLPDNNFGCGGSWNDNGSKWVQPSANGGLIIEVV